MPNPTLLICVDGLDPRYLEACATPLLDDLGKRGFSRIGRCMMPSVTNVNNVSIVTACYPMSHGICSNYMFVRDTGEGVFMESADYVLAETMFQRATRQGKTSLLVASKDKMRTLLADGATVSVSSERPPGWVVEGVGPPPDIYSLEVNGWAIRAASYVMARVQPDLVYVSTTDYAMHAHAPDEPQAQRHLSMLEDALGDLLRLHPDATLLLTADHGMSDKTRMVDVAEALAGHGVRANAVPVIKDRHVIHHSNLGGCVFVYLARGEVAKALDILRGMTGVEEALAREEAAARWMLHGDRIGDIVVTGGPDTVFGDPAQVALPPRLRSHGSAHEQRVPLIGYNGRFEGFEFNENRDLGRYVFERVLA